MKTTVYRISNDGTLCIPLRHVRTTRNGWHTYLQVDTGLEYKTRKWYASTDDLDAVHFFIMQQAEYLKKYPLINAMDIVRFAMSIENAAILADRIVSQRSRRMCGY